MICIKLNTTEDVALKAIEFLEGKGYESIGLDENSTNIVYWNDDNTFSGQKEHELEPSALADSTFIYDNLNDFIEAVNQNNLNGIDMKDLDYIYDKFENLILFLEAEVNNVEDCDEFIEAKKALKSLFEVIETN